MMQVLGVTDDGGRLPKYVGGRIICIHIYMCVCVCVCVCVLYVQVVGCLIKLVYYVARNK